MLPHSFWHPSLRLRILAPAALVAVPAIALILYTNFHRRELAEQAVSQQAERLAGLKALDQQRLIEGTRQLLIAVSQSRDVREGDRATCSAYMRRVVPHLDTGYTNIGLIDAHGTLTCSGFTAVSGSLADRDYFQRAIATKQFVVGEYIVGRKTGQASLPFAFPVLNDAGDVQQVAFVTVDLVHLNQRLASADWPADATIIVTDRAHTILAMHPGGPEWMGRSLKNDPVVAQFGSRDAGVIEHAEREKERLLSEMKRKELEQHYHHAQKMHAVGRLAGGIAHDFNNMLTAILGYCGLLLEDPKLANTHRSDIVEIEKAGKTAAQLTRQLLAFSRREIVEPVILDLNTIVSSIDNMLRRLVGEHIDIQAARAADLHAVKADRAQIDQVILNLAVNARDAMPDGGRITIQTANVHLTEGVVSAYLSAAPGDYVMLAVSDTGTGITPEVMQHLFEPFFTTKSQGKGTGLGLATVYGIVTQNNGGIVLESAAGKGSVFRIYFPRCDERVAGDVPVSAGERAENTHATVLIVEDDPGIRELCRKILSRCGYKVLVADGGDEALQVSEHHDGIIDVLLSDVVMPGISGPRVAEMLIRIRPGLKVIYMSGYTDDSIVRHGVMERDVPFLQKPFTPERLANKIVEVLG